MTNNNKKKRRKWLWLGLGLIVVIIVAVIGFNRFGPNAAATDAAAGTNETATAFVGDLSANATASGQVRPQVSALLSLSQSGTVADIPVTVGDHVAAGDPLITLERSELERAVLNAQQSLAVQEANLAKLLTPASAGDLAAAEASLTSAQAALNDLLNGPSEEEIAQAEADIRAAQADIAAAGATLNDARGSASVDEVQAAQIQLDLAQRAATQAAEQHSTVLVTEPGRFISESLIADLEVSARSQALQANADLQAAQETVEQLLNGDSSSIASASAQLALANAQRDAAEANLALLLQPASDSQLASATATIAQAEAALANLQQGPSDSQIVQMETAVEQARIALRSAENNLADTTLSAPFAGMVTAVNVNQGELANGILLELVDDSNLEVALNVDEIDIGKITEGQPATITLESWPDVEIEGEVNSIAPVAAEDNSAIVSYEVFVGIGETDLPILVGMTANADLLTDSLEGILLVSNAAINADRDTGTFTVNRVVDDPENPDGFEEVEVTIGLRDGRFTQITSGLEEGDELIVGTVAPRFQFGNGPNGEDDGDGGPFGGGG